MQNAWHAEEQPALYTERRAHAPSPLIRLQTGACQRRLVRAATARPSRALPPAATCHTRLPPATRTPQRPLIAPPPALRSADLDASMSGRWSFCGISCRLATWVRGAVGWGGATFMDHDVVGSLYLVMILLDRFLPGSLRSSLAGHIVTITFF